MDNACMHTYTDGTLHNDRDMEHTNITKGNKSKSASEVKNKLQNLESYDTLLMFYK